MQIVRFTVNGKPVEAAVSKDVFLMEFLRDKLKLLGVKNGCSKGHCGTCTVIMNGKAVRSCVVKMSRLEGSSVETIEHLSHNGKLHPVQYSFIQEGASQCGFCTPGMIMASKALLDANPAPTEPEIRTALKNNLCRCTGYSSIMKAVQQASALIQSGIHEIGADEIVFSHSEESLLGQNVPDKSLLDAVQGKIKFGHDRETAGMLHGKVKWSDYPSAEIVSIDDSQAQAIPGVKLVLTSKDVPGVNRIGILRRDQPAIAADLVRFIGDPIAVVFAETEAIASQAVESIAVEYRPLPGVFTIEEAAAPNAPKVHPEGNLCHESRLERGDVETAFAQAAVIVEETYTTPFIEHAFLEPESGIAWLDPDGSVVIEIGTQAPFDDRTQLAEALAMPEDKIRIRQIPMGGAFGGKEDIILHFFLALGALRSGQPVKMVLTREESLRTHPKRHACQMRYKTAASADGHLLAVQSNVVIDKGAYTSLGSDILENMLTFGAGPYYVPNLKLHAQAFFTNNITGGAMRGFGVPQVTFAMEAQMDAMARLLGMDVFEFRRINALDVGLPLASDHILEASVGIKQTISEAEREFRASALPASSKKVGVGVACSLKNIGFGHGISESAGAICELTEQGDVRILLGVADYGQGSRTALTQLAAYELGIPCENIEISYVDTATSPPTGATTASRQTLLSGNAVLSACQGLKKQIFDLAEKELHVQATDLEIKQGNLIHRPSGRSFDLGLLHKSLIAEARYEAPTTLPFTEQPSLMGRQGFSSRRTHYTYSYATHIAIVEVDETSGTVKVLKVIAAHDVGKAINPRIIRGQIEGGVVMGLGYGLSEEFVVQNGVNLTNTLLRCHIPNIEDQPEIVPIIVEDPEPNGPYGAKGVGELAMLPTAAAIANAIYDATGVRVTSLPANKKRVAEALQRAKEAR